MISFVSLFRSFPTFQWSEFVFVIVFMRSCFGVVFGRSMFRAGQFLDKIVDECSLRYFLAQFLDKKLENGFMFCLQFGIIIDLYYCFVQVMSLSQPVLMRKRTYVLRVIVIARGLHYRVSWRGRERLRCRRGKSKIRLPADQVGHSVANGSPPLRRFFLSCVAQALSREDEPATRYSLIHALRVSRGGLIFAAQYNEDLIDD